MAEPSSSPTQPTKLAFALGSLESTVQGVREEQQRQRETLADIPGKIAEIFLPRMILLEASSKVQGEQIKALERQANYIKGALGLGAVVITYVFGRPFIRF